MDRNTFTGLFLIAVILLGFSYFMRPSEAELKKEQVHQDSLKAAKAGIKAASESAKQTETLKSAADTARVIPTGPFSAATVGKQEFVTLENDVIKLKISTKGGRVYSAQLKKFQTYSKQPLILLNGDENVFGLNFTADQKAINTNELYFKPSAEAAMVQGTDSSVLSMRLPYSDQKYIEYDYSLKNGSYMLGFTVKVVNLNDVIAAQSNALLLKWKNDILPQEKASASELRYTTVIAKDNQNDVQSPLSVSKDESKKFEKPLKWISFKQQFFSAVLLTDQEFPAADAASSQDLNRPVVKTLSANIAIPYTHKPSDEFKMRLYLGPNDFTTLKKFGVGLEQEIPLGWGPLRWINQYAVIPVFSLLSKMNWNYGIIILILTILLKAVLFPLTYRSYLSTAKMRVIKPEMDEIKEKIGDSDPTKLQQEYLKLYKKAGVNPLGGCLPMLLQMPILFAFLNFFPNAFELRQQHFLFMEDLSTYDSIIHWSGDIPIISSIFGNHLSVMCILMAATTLIYSILNSQVSAGGPAGNQYKYMSYIFPIMSIAFLNKFSAGLNYYYFCANIITFSQQAIIRRFVNDDEIHRRIQENKKKPVITKKSKFQAKLEEMSKQRNLATTSGKVVPVKTVPNRSPKK